MFELYNAAMMFLNIVWYVMLAHIIMSWLLNFGVLNPRQPLVGQAWYWLNRLLEPIYAPIRQILPPMGGIDLAPLAVFILIIVLRGSLASLLL